MTPQPPRSGTAAWSPTGQANPATELRRSRAQLDLAISAAQMGAFEWNVRTQAVRLDARSREIFGFNATQNTTADEVFSRIHPADVERIRALSLESIARGVRVDVEYRLQLPDGSLRHVASSGVMVPGDDGHTEQVLGVFTDITERRWDAVRNQALVELSDRVRDLDLSQDIALAAAQVVGITLGVGRVAYGVVVDAGNGMVLVERDWTAAGVPSMAGTHCLRDDGSFVDDLVCGEAVAIADARLDTRTVEHAAALEARGARALLNVPLVEHGRLAALLLLNHATPRAWSAKEVLLVREVAERVRDITRRKQAEQALRRSEVRHAFLVRLGDALRALANPAEIQCMTAALLGRHLQASRAYYCEYDDSIGQAVIHHDYTADGQPSMAGTYWLDDFPALHRLLRQGQAAVVQDSAATVLFLPSERAQLMALGQQALVSLPLLKEGRLVASLTLCQDCPRAWTPLEVALVQDTAERTWAAVERARAEDALRQSDRRKDEFLATLAHELRNPLAPLRNGVQLMRLTRPGDERQQRMVQMMERQLTHLVRLVDDLLDVGRISTGKVQLLLQPVELQKILASSIEAARPGIESRGHTLTVECMGDDLRLMADFERLSQVIVNLLSNAAKYTEPGGRIEVTAQREGAEAVVRVADTGVGILREDLVRVFELFSQVRLHQGRSEGGLGIGLALARNLVTMHGGSMSAHSEGADRGSTFSVRLPLLLEGPPRTSAPGWPLSPAVPVKAATRHVLVVDDNVDAGLSLGALLSALGHQVRVAHGGIEALRLAHEAMPETVFMDLGMPCMDGFDAVRRLRAMPGGQALQVVALTGWGQPADRQRTRAAGFDAHLVKPVALSALQQVLGQPDAAACGG